MTDEDKRGTKRPFRNLNEPVMVNADMYKADGVVVAAALDDRGGSVAFIFIAEGIPTPPILVPAGQAKDIPKLVEDALAALARRSN